MFPSMWAKIQPNRKNPVTAMTAFFPMAELQNSPNQVRGTCRGVCEGSGTTAVTRASYRWRIARQGASSRGEAKDLTDEILRRFAVQDRFITSSARCAF